MSESKTQCPLCHNFENHQACCRIGTLELELNEAREEAQRINGSCQLEIQLLRDANKQANAAIGDIANECKSYVSQFTTAQQELAELRAYKKKMLPYENLQAIDSAMKGTKE